MFFRGCRFFTELFRTLSRLPNVKFIFHRRMTGEKFLLTREVVSFSPPFSIHPAPQPHLHRLSRIFFSPFPYRLPARCSLQERKKQQLGVFSEIVDFSCRFLVLSLIFQASTFIFLQLKIDEKIPLICEMVFSSSLFSVHPYSTIPPSYLSPVLFLLSFFLSTHHSL